MSEPCKCHNSHAAVTPTHGGHCCFLPADSTCHADEVEAWTADDELIRRTRKDTP